MDFHNIREDFPATNDSIYLDNGIASPCPRPVVEAINKFYEDRMLYGSCASGSQLEVYENIINKTRGLFAKLINAEEEEVAFCQNTSDSINKIVNVIEWEKGNNVIISDLDYPSITYPWLKLRKSGLDVKIIRSKNWKISPTDIEDAVDERTLVICTSHISYFNGFKQDLDFLGRLARDNNVYFLVDAMQSLGAFQVDVKKSRIDFLASNSYKWLLGPFGLGQLYCRKELLEKFEPVDVGWRSTLNMVERNIEEYELDVTARKFEVGGLDYASIYGLGVALEYLFKVGISDIEERIMELSDLLVEGLQKLPKVSIMSPLERRYRSSIILFNIDNIPAKTVKDKLKERKIIVGTQRRETHLGVDLGVKVSPNFFNTKSEIELFIKTLSKL